MVRVAKLLSFLVVAYLFGLAIGLSSLEPLVRDPPCCREPAPPKEEKEEEKIDRNVPVDPSSVPVVTPVAKFPLGMIVGLIVGILLLVLLILSLLYLFCKLRSFLHLLPPLIVHGGVNSGVKDPECCAAFTTADVAFVTAGSTSASAPSTIAVANVHPPIGPSVSALPSSDPARPLSAALPSSFQYDQSSWATPVWTGR